MINLDTNRYYSLPTSPTQHTCASVWVSVHASERARERDGWEAGGGGTRGGQGGGGAGVCVCVCVWEGVFLNLLTAKSKGKPCRFTDYSAR